MSANTILDSRRLVFIAGLHRSGTSILHACLRDHPQISGFRDTGVREDEGQHLQTVLPRCKSYGGSGRFGFHEAAHILESSPLATAENATRMLEEWSRFWDLTRPVLVEKSPPNLLRTRLLQAMYPEARFLIITRHPVAVSYATQKWTLTTLRRLLDHWLHCHRLLLNDLPHLNHVHVLKYEEFVRDPVESLAAVHRFLDVDEMPPPPRVYDANGKYFSWWKQRRVRVIRWKYLPIGLYLYWLERAYEQRTRHFGYSLQDLNYLGESCLDIACRRRVPARGEASYP